MYSKLCVSLWCCIDKKTYLSKTNKSGEIASITKIPVSKLLIKTPMDSWLSPIPNLFSPILFLSPSLCSYPILLECPRLNQCIQSSELSSRRGWTWPERKIEEVSWLSSDFCAWHKRRPQRYNSFPCCKYCKYIYNYLKQRFWTAFRFIYTCLILDVWISHF